jgi:hypothetical protein
MNTSLNLFKVRAPVVESTELEQLKQELEKYKRQIIDAGLLSNYPGGFKKRNKTK